MTRLARTPALVRAISGEFGPHVTRHIAHRINNLLGAYDRAHRIGLDDQEARDA